MEKIDDGKVMNFLYNIQNRRRINIFYGIFTKIGLAYVLSGYWLFAVQGYGAFMFVMYLSVGGYIYREKMNYRFYDHDKLYFYHHFANYITQREAVPSYSSIHSILSKEEYHNDKN